MFWGDESLSCVQEELNVLEEPGDRTESQETITVVRGEMELLRKGLL